MKRFVLATFVFGVGLVGVSSASDDFMCEWFTTSCFTQAYACGFGEDALYEDAAFWDGFMCDDDTLRPAP